MVFHSVEEPLGKAEINAAGIARLTSLIANFEQKVISANVHCRVSVSKYMVLSIFCYVECFSLRNG